MGKEKVKKKDKWGSTRFKQADNISAEIENRIKEGALRPASRTGRNDRLSLRFKTAF